MLMLPGEKAFARAPPSFRRISEAVCARAGDGRCRGAQLSLRRAGRQSATLLP